jgi:hypothetical protein
VKRINLTSLLVIGTVCIFAGCKQTGSSSSTATSNPTTATKASDQGKPLSFDIILAGPFAYVQNSDTLEVWIPKVEGHNRPFGVGTGDSVVRSFDSGNYDFTTGIQPSKVTKLLAPVQGASVFQLSRAKNTIRKSPGKGLFMTIKLPIPREIIPWNADPIQIDSANPPKTTPELLSTVVILRFDRTAGDSPLMTAPGEANWQPKSEDTGTEHIILLGVNPPEPSQGEDEHVHAKHAFKALTALLGVKLNIAFPQVPYTRNQPLTPGVLPDDLIQFLAPSGGGGKLRVGIFGKTNDCKTANILVGP